MKMTVTISQEEVENAIKDYLINKGFKKVSNVNLKAGQLYDMFDRQCGIGFQNATAEVEQ